MAVSACQHVAFLALGTPVTIVLCAELDGTDVVGEGERSQATQTPLLAVFLASVDLAFPVDCQFERGSALEALLVAIVLKAAKNDLDADIIVPLVPLSTAGALILSLRNTTITGQSKSLPTLHTLLVDHLGASVVLTLAMDIAIPFVTFRTTICCVYFTGMNEALSLVQLEIREAAHTFLLPVRQAPRFEELA